MKNQKNQIKTLSIVIPSFNDEGNIKKLYDRLILNLKKTKYNFEIIFVDDGSTDGTLNQIKKLSSKSKWIKYISFSKNFGHQKALKAGLDFANGEAVISLDVYFDSYHDRKLGEWF